MDVHSTDTTGFQCAVMVVGDSGVGKTSMLMTYATDYRLRDSPDQYIPMTFGVINEEMTDVVVDGQPCRLR